MTKEAISCLCRALSILMVVIGGLGSIACLPFALSYDLRFITIAGIYFVAGAIMIAVGLLNYLLLFKTQQ